MSLTISVDAVFSTNVTYDDEKPEQKKWSTLCTKWMDPLLITGRQTK